MVSDEKNLTTNGNYDSNREQFVMNIPTTVGVIFILVFIVIVITIWIVILCNLVKNLNEKRRKRFDRPRTSTAVEIYYESKRNIIL